MLYSPPPLKGHERDLFDDPEFAQEFGEIGSSLFILPCSLTILLFLQPSKKVWSMSSSYFEQKPHVERGRGRESNTRDICESTEMVHIFKL